jgi:hypothetical protein
MCVPGCGGGCACFIVFVCMYMIASEEHDNPDDISDTDNVGVKGLDDKDNDKTSHFIVATNNYLICYYVLQYILNEVFLYVGVKCLHHRVGIAHVETIHV